MRTKRMRSRRWISARRTLVYVVAATALFVVTPVLGSLMGIGSFNDWSFLGSYGQLAEAYVVLISAGVIALEVRRSREESVEHKIRMFEFLRSLFYGSDYSLWHDTLVKAVRAHGKTRGRSALDDPRAKAKLAEYTGHILSTFDVLNRFIDSCDLDLDELVEYQGNRIWELSMAFKTLDFHGGPFLGARWARQNARELVDKVARTWRERAEKLGSGTIPYRWP